MQKTHLSKDHHYKDVIVPVLGFAESIHSCGHWRGTAPIKIPPSRYLVQYLLNFESGY